MRKILFSGLLILAVLLILPLSVMKKPDEAPTVSTSVPLVTEPAKKTDNTFRIYNHESGEILTLSAEDYIFGVVAAEMPALYEPEALKAQAVAAYTFACKRREGRKNEDYDLSTDHTTDQSFIAEDKLEAKWGEKTAEYTEKIKAAVKAVEGLGITYKGEPILSVYHAISAGKTEDSKNVWGGEMAGLKSVASPYDKLSPKYISSAEITVEDFKKALSDECEFSGDASKYLGKINRTEQGTVKTVTICGTAVSGSKIRSAFELRSTNFELSFASGKFIFTVYGYGHNVGMSQYGADYMAKQGSDFKEILKHYYKDCNIEKI